MTNTISETRTRAGQFLQSPILTPRLERQFQTEYYARIRHSLRLVSLLLAGLVAAQALFESRLLMLMPTDLANSTPALVLWLCVFVLTWVPGFGRFWQPALVCLGLSTASIALSGLGHALMHPPDSPQPASSGVPKFLFALQMTVLMVTLSTLRLSFRWTALLQGGVLCVGLWNFTANLPTDSHALQDTRFILLPALFVLLALLLAAFVQEQLARGAFWASQLLEEERRSEQQRREQTENHLHVLAQAIGGIAHDLGNPMTSVQMGTEILSDMADTGDFAGMQTVSAAVLEGAQMLAALRLSLMEQTRVLEGKPVPVDLRTVLLRPIIESGARFQSSRLTFERKMTLDGEDFEVQADRLKLATVFMNLIGNALKYSDGEIQILWQASGEMILVGILDQGTAGRGISEAQTTRLFTPFGRLDDHADIEGTGLGLVSALKVVEAHGGEVFVEGYQNGTSDSALFSTASRQYPSLLTSGFLTGFIVVCPA